MNRMNMYGMYEDDKEKFISAQDVYDLALENKNKNKNTDNIYIPLDFLYRLLVKLEMLIIDSAESGYTSITINDFNVEVIQRTDGYKYISQGIPTIMSIISKVIYKLNLFGYTVKTTQNGDIISLKISWEQPTENNE